jgi:hypothetical protein
MKGHTDWHDREEDYQRQTAAWERFWWSAALAGMVLAPLILGAQR